MVGRLISLSVSAADAETKIESSFLLSAERKEKTNRSSTFTNRDSLLAMIRLTESFFPFIQIRKEETHRRTAFRLLFSHPIDEIQIRRINVSE